MTRRTTTAIALLAILFMAGAHPMNANAATETVTLGGGCFWCIEAVFEELDGVMKAESGYAGGSGTPTYQEVCTGETGHAEVVQITFNPEVTSYEEVLAVFFTVHDPTTLNRQGADVGTQYRSAIFYHSQRQKEVAEKMIRQLEKEKVYRNPVVTQLEKFEHFYRAENYHQNYYANNPNAGYCRAVINPKVQKFRQKFAHKRK